MGLKYKIGVLTNYEYSKEEQRERTVDAQCEFVFAKAALADAIEIGLDMQNNQGVHAILTTSLTRRYLENRLDIPVLPLMLKNYDLIRAMLQAHRLGEKPAFLAVDTQQPEYDFAEIVGLLDFEVRYYEFAGLENAHSKLDEIVEDGCDVILSMGNVTIPLAKERGMPTVYMTPDIRTFHEAVAQVKALYAEREKEAQKAKWINTFVSESSEGILAWETSNKVTIFNNSAQRAFQIEEREVLNKPLENFFKLVPQAEALRQAEGEYTVLQLDGKNHVVNAREVRDGQNNLLGKYYRFNELGRIKKMELFARRKMSETGFIAQTHFEDIKGNSDRLKDVKAMAQVYAQSDVNILIYGESGTGKEVFAQSIHNHSNFKDGPFVAVNCTALTDTLMESELFGYEDGAFTGAKKGGKPGLFEMAHGGTLFLDEIGDMPLALQVKLLRVLQERNVRRVGGSKSLPLNIRCIFATNQNLAHAVQEKRFREDLYYRINVLSLHIPPLRERAQDIPILAKDIAAKASARMGRSYFFPKDCADLLQRYSWPGNVRELTNFMERVIVLKARDRKTIEQMIAELLPARELPRETGFDAPLPDEEHLCVRIDSLRRMEDEIIQALLQKYGGDKKRVEWVLGVSSTTLWRRFKAMEQNGGR